MTNGRALIESSLCQLAESNCVLVAIRYDKEDGAAPAWRLLHSPSIKDGKRGKILRARDENSDASKTWNIERIREIYLPDSPRLRVQSWLLNTPIQFDVPIPTPSGSRVKVV